MTQRLAVEAGSRTAAAKDEAPDLSGATMLIILAIGLAVIVAVFLSRRKCIRCRKIFHTLLFWKKRDLCVRCQAETGKVTLETRVLSYVAFFVLLTMAFLLVRERIPRSAGFWPESCLSAGIAILCVIGCCALLNREFRGMLKRMARRAIRRSEAMDFRAAGRAAGAKGQVIRRHGYTLWTDQSASVVGEIEKGLERARNAVLGITGSAAEAKRPLRIICFDKEAGFRAYAAPIVHEVGQVAGYYFPGFGKRVVLCGEFGALYPNTLEGVAAHEIAHHLLWRRTRRGAWIQEGLAVMASGSAMPALEPFARQRVPRAALARGELFEARQLFATTYTVISAGLKDPTDVRAFGRMGTFYTQSADFLAFLRQSDENRFARFILSRRPRRGSARVFRRCFGLEPEEAIAQWRDRHRTAKIPAHQPPPAKVRERVDAEVVPLIRDSAVPLARRLLAVGRLAALGYLWRLDVLIELMEKETGPLRAAAQRALENVSGEVGRPSPEEWRAWWQSVAGDSLPWVETKDSRQAAADAGKPGAEIRREQPAGGEKRVAAKAGPSRAWYVVALVLFLAAVAAGVTGLLLTSSLFAQVLSAVDGKAGGQPVDLTGAFLAPLICALVAAAGFVIAPGIAVVVAILRRRARKQLKEQNPMALPGGGG